MPIESRNSIARLFFVQGSPSTLVSQKIRLLQESLIENAEAFIEEESLPQNLKDAFFATPRHRFAPRFPDGRPGLWSDVDDDLLLPHLDALYDDQPYCIFRDEYGETVSTISQPSLVLYMLYLLELSPGHRVFELGGGSGWNAALMGRLVGEQGQVVSVEIEDSLVANAQRALSELGLTHVSLISGDAYEEIVEYPAFDRGVFTASAWELPRFFFEKIVEDGRLIFVLKFDSQNDVLLSLRKTKGHFVSERHFPCRFVPTTGKDQHENRQTPSPEEKRFLKKFRSSGIDVEDLALEVHPHSDLRETKPGEFAFARGDSQFVWRFPEIY